MRMALLRMNNVIFRILLIVNWCCSFIALNASEIYPIINEDNSVTFRMRFPEAYEVKVKGTMFEPSQSIATQAGVFSTPGKKNMKLEYGCWKYTTKPLKSGLYTYCYEVDEVELIDSLNSNIIREGNEYMNYFIIKGGIGDDYVYNTDISHGKIEEAWYPSTIEGLGQRRLMVYLPNGYNDSKTKRYPVLYLLHGSGGDEESWIDCGRLPQIMDNLIAQKRCEPMIVVMPNGIANRVAAPGKNPNDMTQKSSSVNIESMLGSIEESFVKDIVKWIDSNYRTINKKEGRAIAGLSLGGLQTIYISLNNPDVFDFVGLFSAQASNAMTKQSISDVEKFSKDWEALASVFGFMKKGKIGKRVTELSKIVSTGNLDIYDNLDEKLEVQFANPPKLYYITLGRDDFVKTLNDNFRAKLDDKGYNYEYIETDGGHTWDNWRKYLVDYLPRLFR